MKPNPLMDAYKKGMLPHWLAKYPSIKKVLEKDQSQSPEALKQVLDRLYHEG